MPRFLDPSNINSAMNGKEELGYGFIGTPDGFQQLVTDPLAKIRLGPILDLDSSKLKILPEKTIYCVNRFYSNNDLFIVITKYFYAKEKSSDRGGTFAGAVLGFKNCIPQAFEVIKSSLDELSDQLMTRFLNPKDNHRFLSSLKIGELSTNFNRGSFALENFDPLGIGFNFKFRKPGELDLALLFSDHNSLEDFLRVALFHKDFFLSPKIFGSPDSGVENKFVKRYFLIQNLDLAIANFEDARKIATESEQIDTLPPVPKDSFEKNIELNDNFKEVDNTKDITTIDEATKEKNIPRREELKIDEGEKSLIIPKILSNKSSIEEQQFKNSNGSYTEFGQEESNSKSFFGEEFSSILQYLGKLKEKTKASLGTYWMYYIGGGTSLVFIIPLLVYFINLRTSIKSTVQSSKPETTTTNSSSPQNPDSKGNSLTDIFSSLFGSNEEAESPRSISSGDRNPRSSPDLFQEEKENGPRLNNEGSIDSFESRQYFEMGELVLPEEDETLESISSAEETIEQKSQSLDNNSQLSLIEVANIDDFKADFEKLINHANLHDNCYDTVNFPNYYFTATNLLGEYPQDKSLNKLIASGKKIYLDFCKSGYPYNQLSYIYLEPDRGKGTNSMAKKLRAKYEYIKFNYKNNTINKVFKAANRENSPDYGKRYLIYFPKPEFIKKNNN